MLVCSFVFFLSHVRNLGVRMTRVMLFCYPLRGNLVESVPAHNLCVVETAIASSIEIDSSIDFSRTIFEVQEQTD